MEFYQIKVKKKKRNLKTNYQLVYENGTNTEYRQFINRLLLRPRTVLVALLLLLTDAAAAAAAFVF